MPRRRLLNIADDVLRTSVYFSNIYCGNVTDKDDVIVPSSLIRRPISNNVKLLHGINDKFIGCSTNRDGTRGSKQTRVTRVLLTETESDIPR